MVIISMQKRKSIGNDCCQAKIAAEAIFKHYDVDRNGVLDSAEVFSFIEEIMQLKRSSGETSVEDVHAKLFKLGDENGDNKLSMGELIDLLKRVFDHITRKKSSK